MTPEKRIEKYYIERLKKYDSAVNDVITTILGSKFKKLLVEKKDFFCLIFTASKEGLEHYLSETPEKEDKEIMEYLLEKIESKDENLMSGENAAFLINKNSPITRYDKEYDEWLKSKRKFLESYFHINKIFVSYCKIDIFEYQRDGLYLDILYIWRLLTHLVMDYKNNNFYYPERTFTIDSKIEESNEEIYTYIINTLAIQIVALLRQKNIYLLDNPNDYDEEKTTGKYKMVSPKFISAFQDLLPLFLLEPTKFIDIVGADNFRDFTICTLDKNSELDIDEIINRMLIEREKKIAYEIVGINVPLIDKSKEKAEEEKKKQSQNIGNNKPQALRTYTRLKSEAKFRDLIFDNLPIINNINNLIEIDNNKYNKNFTNNDREKYINPDDLPPRR